MRMPCDCEDGNYKTRKGTLSRLFLYSPFFLRQVSAAVRRPGVQSATDCDNSLPSGQPETQFLQLSSELSLPVRTINICC